MKTTSKTKIKTKAKPMPSLKSDAEAEQFVDSADLSTFDLSGFKPMRFEFESKAAALNMRLPQNLLDALKNKAKQMEFRTRATSACCLKVMLRGELFRGGFGLACCDRV